MSLTIAIAQVNPIVGDVNGNLALVRRARDEAARLGADLVVFPELVLVGYPPEDLVLRPALVEAAAETRTPLIGVCLGHQAIGQAFGGKVVRAGEIVHGKLGTIHHQATGVFADLPSPLHATRYHSLIVERETLPASLEVNAELADGTIMGLAHRELPIHGVQFHPESIASEHGHALLRNFLDLARVAA